jgi:branched-chain amino acid transport system ATP-binding protein
MAKRMIATNPVISCLGVEQKPEPLMRVDNVSLSFGGVQALRDVSFDIASHEIRAIIGPNGAGKSSLLNLINGVYSADQGDIVYRGRRRNKEKPYQIARQGIARTFQNIALFKGMNTQDNLMTGRIIKTKYGLLAQAIWQGKAQKEEAEHMKHVVSMMAFLGLESVRYTPVSKLSYGLQKRVELGRALLAEPCLLLLDEPMAGMNLEEKQQLSRIILDVNAKFGTTIVLIEHDMRVVMDIADRIVVLDYGKKIADGDAQHVSQDEQVIRAYLG